MAVFEKTQNLVDFAKANGVTNIEMVSGSNPDSPREGAFVSFNNGTTARLSKNVEKLSTDLAISWFVPEDGEPSWMIHPKGESNRDTLDSLAI
jgi:hypothetical protein